MAMSTEQFVKGLARDLAQRDKTEALVQMSGMLLSLMRKIEKLEQRPEVRYCGIWRDGEAYQPGALVTLSGSMWHCNRETISKPGVDANWQLCVKNGSFK